MSQYKTGTATVTIVSGESVKVYGSGTLWLTNVSAGDLFRKQGANVLYEIASVTNDSEIILTSPYVGSGESGISYSITKDFTPYLELPEVWAGDIDWPYTITKSLREIDTFLGMEVIQPTPNAQTTSGTLTIAGLLTGIITGTHSTGSTATYTLPTGDACELGGDFLIDQSFEWSLINLSLAVADTITIAANTGHTIVGNSIVQSAHADSGGKWGSSGLFRTRKIAKNTFITYRIS